MDNFAHKFWRVLPCSEVSVTLLHVGLVFNDDMTSKAEGDYDLTMIVSFVLIEVRNDAGRVRTTFGIRNASVARDFAGPLDGMLKH